VSPAVWDCWLPGYVGISICQRQPKWADVDTIVRIAETVSVAQPPVPRCLVMTACHVSKPPSAERLYMAATCAKPAVSKTPDAAALAELLTWADASTRGPGARRHPAHIPWGFGRLAGGGTDPGPRPGRRPQPITPARDLTNQATWVASHPGLGRRGSKITPARSIRYPVIRVNRCGRG
jgi:hypothetical protein